MENKIFAVRTTIGRERSVADMMTTRTSKEGFMIYSILVPCEIRGYVLVEAVNKTEIEKSLRGVSHARGVVEGEVAFPDIEKFFVPKPMVTKVDTGDIVELISGPFRGEKARVVRVDLKKEEITVELFEATVPIPVTTRGDSIKVLRKEAESEAND
ncbi:MAG: transcription elongation factor Spt5 [Methanobacteriota archaeon]|jgi:transcriptional antiterminator NusG|nr:transcription elongation factor Spt5 [Candidatus Hydrothermarchaeota archaeon]